MLDWSVLIIPLAVLAIVLLLPFAGCGLQTSGEASGEPATIETTVIPITLWWVGSATDIRTISFWATVQPLKDPQTAVGPPVSPPGNSTSGWEIEKSYVASAGDLSVDATVPMPLQPQYRVTANVTVIQGTWGSDAFPSAVTPATQTFNGTSNWHFVLAQSGATWNLT